MVLLRWPVAQDRAFAMLRPLMQMEAAGKAG